MSVTLSRRRSHARVMTAAEALLWSHLRERRLEDWCFRRRRGDGGQVLFECLDANLTVQLQPDAETGPLRFTSAEVLNETESVLQAILLALRTALSHRRGN